MATWAAVRVCGPGTLYGVVRSSSRSVRPVPAHRHRLLDSLRQQADEAALAREDPRIHPGDSRMFRHPGLESPVVPPWYRPSCPMPPTCRRAGTRGTAGTRSDGHSLADLGSNPGAPIALQRRNRWAGIPLSHHEARSIRSAARPSCGLGERPKDRRRARAWKAQIVAVTTTVRPTSNAIRLIDALR